MFAGLQQENEDYDFISVITVSRIGLVPILQLVTSNKLYVAIGHPVQRGFPAAHRKFDLG